MRNATEAGSRVLLHSGREKDELEAIVKQVGADGCIPKTPNPAEFLAAFRTLAGERGR